MREGDGKRGAGEGVARRGGRSRGREWEGEERAGVWPPLPGNQPQQVTLLRVTKPLSRGRSQGRGQGGRAGRLARNSQGSAARPPRPASTWSPAPAQRLQVLREGWRGCPRPPPPATPALCGRTASHPGAPLASTQPLVARFRGSAVAPRCALRTPPRPPGAGERGPADTPPAFIAAAPPPLRARTQDSRPLQVGWPGRPQKYFFPLALPPAPAPPASHHTGLKTAGGQPRPEQRPQQEMLRRSGAPAAAQARRRAQQRPAAEMTEPPAGSALAPQPAWQGDPPGSHVRVGTPGREKRPGCRVLPRAPSTPRKGRRRGLRVGAPRPPSPRRRPRDRVSSARGH